MPTWIPRKFLDLTEPPAQTLAAWLAEEQEARERTAAGPGAGVADADEVLGRSGLDALQAMLSGQLPHAPIADTLGFRLLAVERGWALFQGQPDFAYLNPMGGVHGGWYATLLDSALGCAVHSLLDAGKGYTTLSLSINLVKALSMDVRRVRAEGRVLHVGRQVATSEAHLYGPDGTLYAHGSTTCLIFDAGRATS